MTGSIRCSCSQDFTITVVICQTISIEKLCISKLNKMFKVIRKQFLPLFGPETGVVCTCFTASPQHLSQNLISEIFNSSGFLPRREAPVISFSVRNVGFWNIRSTRHKKRRGTRRDSLAFLTSFSCNSIQDSRDVRHYESRVFDRWPTSPFLPSKAHFYLIDGCQNEQHENQDPGGKVRGC